MSKKRRVEVFTAGCPVCDEALKLVKEIASESCEVIIYNLNEPCESGECLDKVRSYGIHRIPAVAVNGRLAGCCVAGPVTAEGLRAAVEGP